jgi:hypothetical protein
MCHFHQGIRAIIVWGGGLFSDNTEKCAFHTDFLLKMLRIQKATIRGILADIS